LDRDTTEFVIWLDAPESRYQGWEETGVLPKRPRAKKTDTIICCTFSRVRVLAGGVGTEAGAGKAAELEAPTKTW